MKSEIRENVRRYRASISVFREMLKQGIISPEEYARIDTIITKKYGLDSCSIFSDISG